MRLIVGYLATPSGDDGLALGVRLARTLGAALDLCMVLPHDRLGTVGGFDQFLADQAQQWLDEAAATVPDDIEVATHVSFGESFAEGLIEESARLGAEAIVVGAAGDGLIGRYSVGSVTGELLHSSPVPLALAPRGTRHSTAQRVREVTCALGRRQGADLLLATAVRASAAAGTPLRLVSLVALDPAFGTLRDDAESTRDRAIAHARQTLDAAKAELPEGFPVESTIVDGPSVEAAVNKLDWHDGDLIMVGSSRLSAPRRLFLGSTAAKMLRVLEVPMVVVPREQLGEEDLP
ncbi:universal stress protein [Mycolicibacterium tokaiense]|uniref:Universal stress protein UspA-like protein n=1 Tax=Mycolicibacterium tokaiense TaxID=39695 RepID=A0A378TCM2_9MYCO|nr:universal stress protein [Mycolicibacterium tokaiense]BBY87591.1 universal stress protein UspA [Mycolicibacterium tokaiense]STZ57887.1 universal stress protein UspA-like protein [Mycolicibacterium tokaiense]